MKEAIPVASSGNSAEPGSKAVAGMAFHAWMAGSLLVLLATDWIGCRRTQVRVPHIGASVVAAVLLAAIWQALPLYWHRKGRFALRDASLTLLWAALAWIMLPYPVDIAARLGRAFPLRDSLLASLDAHLGFNVAAVAHWAAQHWLGRAINESYALLTPMIVLGFLVPGLTGKARAVKRLLAANLVAFAVGVPVFAMVPAVGPWYGEHFAPNPVQTVCEADLLRMRETAPYEHRPAGVVCFPSFHVMWAVLSAEALACFRWLRWPAWILAALIVVSTMTTGWHYFCDVLGGFALAAVAITAAHRLVRT